MRPAPLLTALLTAAPTLAQVPTDGAKFAATHESQPAALAFDGDEETCWAGEGHSLADLPTSLLVTFPEEVTGGRLEVVTQVMKARLRLRDMEVYARVGDGWALLGKVEGNEATRFGIDLAPAKLKVLRLRVRATARDDNAWPRINEVVIREAPPGATPAELEAAEIADESYAERLFVERALGIRKPIEPTTYDPEKGYLWYVRSCLDALIEHGTDTYGDVHSPMWVSILDIDGKTHPNVAMPPIEGQRQGDRALFGGNLQHDVMTLRACDYLTQLTGEQKYRNAAGNYLRYFLEHCTGSATGLWPWGEHAHWDFYKEAPGSTTHEYLGAPPLEFWELAWKLNPDAVLGQADGLLNHVTSLETFDYNRHADISKPLPTPRPEITGFLDFPRHGGFYIQTWAFTYSKTGDTKYLGWCEGMMDHHVAARHPKTGLLPSTTTRDNASFSAATQLSLAVTMLESVPLLGKTETATRCRKLAVEYLASMAALPHRPQEGLYVSGCPVNGPGKEPNLTRPGFTAHYGGAFLAMDALLWLRAHQLTGEQAYKDLAMGLARFYARTDGVPEGAVARAHVYGSIIDLMVDMHQADGGEQWLPAAERYAKAGIETLSADGLFRGATGLWYYESETWPGTLAYALVRLHAVTTESEVEVAPSYFHR